MNCPIIFTTAFLVSIGSASVADAGIILSPTRVTQVRVFGGEFVTGPIFSSVGPFVARNPIGPSEQMVLVEFEFERFEGGSGEFSAEFEMDIVPTSPGILELYGGKFNLPPPPDRFDEEDLEILLALSPIEEMIIEESDVNQRLRTRSLFDMLEQQVQPKSTAILIRESVEGSESFTVDPTSITLTITPIPEPSTLAIWSTVILSVLVHRRKKSRSDGIVD